MTEEELRAIEARLTKASPGPWAIIHNGFSDVSVISTSTNVRQSAVTWVAETLRQDANAALIAAAPADLAALLAEVRLLQGIIRDMQQDSDAYRLGMEAGRLELLEAYAALAAPAAWGCGWCWREEGIGDPQTYGTIRSDVMALLEGGKDASDAYGKARSYKSRAEAMSDLKQAISKLATMPPKKEE